MMRKRVERINATFLACHRAPFARITSTYYLNTVVHFEGNTGSLDTHPSTRQPPHNTIMLSMVHDTADTRMARMS